MKYFRIIFSFTIYLANLNTTIAQSVPLNGPTPWEVIGNSFSQPNVTMQIGKDSLEWYGSGDVNLDNKIDSLDYEKMNSGTLNDMADIDGDGTPSTGNDKAILLEYLNGGREYLPGHWNELKTPEERENWFSKMYNLTDVLNGTPPGWVCSNWIAQTTLKHYGVSNYQEGFNQGFIVSGTNLDSVAKFNLPLYYFSTTTTNGVSHAISGILVGRNVSEDSTSYNPLDFKDWSFRSYQHKSRINPGDWDIDPNHPVIMKKKAYIKNPINGQNYFNLTGSWIEWSLTNGEPNLTYYWNGSNIKLLLENPNVIKVDVEDLEDIVVNADGFPKNTNWTPEFLESLGYNAKPEVTTQNTLLNPTTTYADKDTVWYSDSTGYSFDRYFKSKIYSGGYTKWDTTSHKISLDNLVSVEGDKNSHLEDFEISQNYPNPFNPSTTIEFSVPVKANVNISIYNTLGELVTNLHSGTMEAGYHQIKFDASRFTSGTYIYRINVNDGKLFSDSKKMLLIK